MVLLLMKYHPELHIDQDGQAHRDHPCNDDDQLIPDMFFVLFHRQSEFFLYREPMILVLSLDDTNHNEGDPACKEISITKDIRFGYTHEWKSYFEQLVMGCQKQCRNNATGFGILKRHAARAFHEMVDDDAAF